MKKRIEWIDIFRGIAIVLMVIGHSNSPINGYIYTFHMAAFLFISGFVNSIENKSFISFILRKIKRILIPYYLVNLGFQMLVEIIANSPYGILYYKDRLGIFKRFELFFKNGISVDLAGATWFLLVLFQISILFFIIKKYCIKNDVCYMFISIVLFIYGYYLIIVKKIYFQNLYELTLIGQFYFTLGYMFKKYNIFSLMYKKYIKEVIFFISCIGIYILTNIFPSYVDYPSRNFKNFLLESLASFFGIYFLFYISQVIKCSKIKFIKKEFIKFGQYSIEILIFHFLSFRVFFTLGYKLRFLPIRQLSNLVPINKNNYWLILTIFSIYLSLILSKILNFIIRKIYYICKLDKFNLKILNNLKFSFKRNKMLDIILEFRNIFFMILKKLKKIDKKNILIGLIFIIVVLFPIYRAGIVVNDELQARYFASQGMKNFFYHYLNLNFRIQGRISLASIINWYINYISIKQSIFKLIEIMIIISNIFFFEYFLKIVTKNKKLSYLSAIIFIIFLPITWEHVPPNAFSSLFGISISFLFISLIFYKKYIDDENKILYLWISLCLYIYCLLTYELFVLYFILYVMLAWNKRFKDLKELFLKLKCFLISIVSYIMIFIFWRLKNPSSYDGNKLVMLSISKTINGIFFMFKSSFPGYYLFNKKYNYLVTISNENIRFRDNLINIRIIIFAILVLYLLNKIMNLAVKKIKFKNELLIYLVSIMLIVLPVVPRVLSKSNQENNLIGSENLIAFPNTYFAYFASVFLISFIIYKIKNKILIYIVLCFILVLSLKTQFMNEVISLRQKKEYERLADIERLFSTIELSKWNRKKIFSKTLYETRYSLGIHDGYWSDFSKIRNLDIKISRNFENQEGIITDRSLDTREVFIIGKIEKKENNQYLVKEISILSLKNLDLKKIYFRSLNNQYEMLKLSNGIKDNQFYKYNLRFENDVFIESIDITN